jgi:IclR family acetate operon transcriptional repressor
MVDSDGPRTGTQSVERAIAVLRCFERTDDLGVTEIAAHTGLAIPTAHRIVRALQVGGLVDQDPATERYHLGFTTAVLGRLALRRLGFSFAVPEIEELAARTGEATNLGVRTGREVLVLHSVPSVHPLRFDQAPGSRNPIHVCAMGKVLMAFEGPGALIGDRFERFTPNTLTTRHQLEDQFERIRANGYSFNDEERISGVRAIAAPIFDPLGRPVAAIALQGPTVRFTDDRLPELIDELTFTAAKLNKQP